MDNRCQLCDRKVDKLTKHHLLPREEGGNEEHISYICSDCHRQIHALYTNKELAIRLDSIDKLKNDEKIHKYLKFIKKQPASKIATIKKSEHSYKWQKEEMVKPCKYKVFAPIPLNEPGVRWLDIAHIKSTSFHLGWSKFIS